MNERDAEAFEQLRIAAERAYYERWRRDLEDEVLAQVEAECAAALELEAKIDPRHAHHELGEAGA